MNETKENIVILSRYEYDSLKENLTKADEGLKKRDKLYNIFENYFWNDLLGNDIYTLKHIEEENLDNYYFKALVCKALQEGITDIDYISKKIIEYKEKFNETVKGEEDGERDKDIFS